MCVQASVCVCVCVREGERDTGSCHSLPCILPPQLQLVCVCVCVPVLCVCVRERDTGSCHFLPCILSSQLSQIPLPFLSITQSTMILSPLTSKLPPHSTSFPTEILKTSYQLYVCAMFPHETGRLLKAGTMCLPVDARHSGHSAARTQAWELAAMQGRGCSNTELSPQVIKWNKAIIQRRAMRMQRVNQ